MVPLPRLLPENVPHLLQRLVGEVNGIHPKGGTTGEVVGSNHPLLGRREAEVDDETDFGNDVLAKILQRLRISSEKKESQPF